MKGNEALAEAAIRAEIDGYFGYPITPQSEILEYLSKNFNEEDGVVLQAESEIAAINMVFGAAGSGKRVMTSTSSPGMSLMLEGVSYIAAAQLPCLLVNISRGGPGLGTIQPSQADYFQSTKGGGHGDYRLIVLAPNSVQEMADFVFDAIYLAEKYRNPALILSDGTLGQMMEKVRLPEKGSLPKFIPDWAAKGKRKDKERNIILTSAVDPAVMENLNKELQKKYALLQSEVRYELNEIEDAQILIVAFGLSARICNKAQEIVKEKGVSVGLLRPITLYPFPSDTITKLSKKVQAILVVELNAGQMVEDVKLAVNGNCPVHFYGRMGGELPTPEEIYFELKKIIDEQSIEK
ncbi:MAG: 3-methyl-2-oxobutanoate dehydrogenase subunit VorB [Ignavibacteriales bacterium CG_4_9_14_3_um_filter_30_11]|nr:MAG: 3-methyl-2-oxobutanoate dehydrogenase subunit VorB [Ignavibacteriales bacterium CG_4_9_14_3_um_filter_30_11]